MTADLSALIARLEAAEMGSRDLDAHVEVAARAFEAAKTGLAREHWAVWRASSSGIVGDGATQYASAPVTTSLDAALALAEQVHGEARALDLLQDVLSLHDASGISIRDLPRLLCSFILRAKQGEGE